MLFFIRNIIFSFLFIISSHSLLGQKIIYPSECDVLEQFFSSKKAVDIFNDSRIVDSIYEIADVDNLLNEKCIIKRLGNFKINITHSKLIADTVHKESIFEIKNRNLNFYILKKNTFNKSISYSLYNPLTNYIYSIEVYKKRKQFILKKYSSGWF